MSSPAETDLSAKSVLKPAYITYEWSLSDISDNHETNIKDVYKNATSKNISHHCRESRAFAEENCCRVYYMYF